MGVLGGSESLRKHTNVLVKEHTWHNLGAFAPK